MTAVAPAIALATGLTVILGGCSWNENRSEQLGTAVGGVVGAVLGSKIGSGAGRSISTVMGATLGAMWGQDIAKGLSEVDKVYAERTTQDTLEYGKPGETSTWSNPDSGHSGTVTADEVYTTDNGENCREFETSVFVDNEERTATGTACKDTDGTWRVVDQPEQST